jgi:hypothetical protein
MKAKASTKPRGHGDQPARLHHEPSEFSRLVAVDDLPAQGLDLTIQADAVECAALAARAGLVAVESFAADFRLRKVRGSKVQVEGVLRARVVQTCVVSLDPFESDIESPIEAEFEGDAEPEVVPARFRDERGSPSPVRGAELEAPDPIIDGRIDLGALAAEFLMLSLDPYPRKPGVSFDAAGVSVAGDETGSPFAALRKFTGSGGHE